MSLHTAKKQKTTTQTVLMWFRTDLRLKDNTALHRASLTATNNNKIPLVGLYVISPAEWKKNDVSELRIDFWLRNLEKLHESLSKLDIPLIIKTADTIERVPELVAQVASDLNARTCYWNKEYEVNEQKRDQKAVELLQSKEINAVQCDDQCIVPPGLVLTKESKTYTIFTPFKKTWIQWVLFNLKKVEPLPEPAKNSLVPSEIREYATRNSQIDYSVKDQRLETTTKMFPAGEQEASSRLAKFLLVANDYNTKRDFPSVEGTSKISPYLSAGVISARVCLYECFKSNSNRMDSGSAGMTTWISELCWRDFYKHILVAFPRVCKNKPFKLDTDKIKWSYDQEMFGKWTRGETGFPLVDAAMRQLNATGWMHNRLRMVTAMFLTKDLLVNWRMGERYFMQNLIDGDFSANNGGWQWAASTGTDAVPYFRIFNPTTQSERFDKDGKFIKKWLPELQTLSTSQIHDPFGKLSEKEFAKLGYFKPIVDHKTARETTIAAFKAATGKE